MTNKAAVTRTNRPTKTLLQKRSDSRRIHFEHEVLDRINLTRFNTNLIALSRTLSSYFFFNKKFIFYKKAYSFYSLVFILKKKQKQFIWAMQHAMSATKLTSNLVFIQAYLDCLEQKNNKIRRLFFSLATQRQICIKHFKSTAENDGMRLPSLKCSWSRNYASVLMSSRSV